MRRGEARCGVWAERSVELIRESIEVRSLLGMEVRQREVCQWWSRMRRRRIDRKPKL